MFPSLTLLSSLSPFRLIDHFLRPSSTTSTSVPSSTTGTGHGPVGGGWNWNRNWGWGRKWNWNWETPDGLRNWLRPDEPINWWNRAYLADWLVINILFAYSVHMSFAPPFERSFDPTDPSISFKKKHSQVDKDTQTNLTFWLPIVNIIGVAMIKRSLLEMHHSLLGFWVGRTIQKVIITMLKNGIGRLTPDFMKRCKWDEALKACTGNPQKIWSGRKSFPSGHQGTAFADLVFLSLLIAGKTGAFSFLNLGGSPPSLQATEVARQRRLAAQGGLEAEKVVRRIGKQVRNNNNLDNNYSNRNEMVSGGKGGQEEEGNKGAESPRRRNSTEVHRDPTDATASPPRTTLSGGATGGQAEEEVWEDWEEEDRYHLEEEEREGEDEARYLLQGVGLPGGPGGEGDQPTEIMRSRVVSLTVTLWPIFLAAWIGVTRLQDHAHNPADVITGSAIGALAALVGYLAYYPNPFHTKNLSIMSEPLVPSHAIYPFPSQPSISLAPSSPTTQYRRLPTSPSPSPSPYNYYPPPPPSRASPRSPYHSNPHSYFPPPPPPPPRRTSRRPQPSYRHAYRAPSTGDARVRMTTAPSKDDRGRYPYVRGGGPGTASYDLEQGSNGDPLGSELFDAKREAAALNYGVGGAANANDSHGHGGGSRLGQNVWTNGGGGGGYGVKP